MVEERHNSHSVSRLAYHIVWCTKFRHDVIDDQVELVIKNTLGQACLTYGWKMTEFNTDKDHVHVLVEAGPSEAPSVIARTLKSLSAIQVFTHFPKLKGRKFWGSGLWSPSTFYGSVGDTNEGVIRDYIKNQKKR